MHAPELRPCLDVLGAASVGLLLAGCTLLERDASPTLSPELLAGTRWEADAAEIARAAQGSPALPRRGQIRTPRLERGDELLQGYAGIVSFESGGLFDGGSADYIDEPDLDELPLFGGGGQWVLGGEAIDLGIEGGASFSLRAEAEALVLGGSGALVAVDVDLFLFDVYGGAFASTFVGRNLRLFAAAGPLLQLAFHDHQGDAYDETGAGVGLGWYARTGLDVILPSGLMVGLGVRWSEARVDVGSDLGDLDLDGLQVYISGTTGP